MDKKTIRKLRLINQKFYQTFADSFSQTRQRVQPGVQKIIERIPLDAAVLELGCGNGSVIRQLVRVGYRGFYLGIDLSQELLAVAREGLSSPQNPQAFFAQLDLITPDWDRDLSSILVNLNPPLLAKKFQIILAFAVMHHLPGVEVRRNFLRCVHQFLASDGLFIHSNWQFFNSPKLRKRVLDWSVVGLSSQDVDPNDYLLDWRLGGTGIRYVHHFGEEELLCLAEETGFSIIEQFYSDGESGKLGLYQVWQLTGSQHPRDITD